MSLGQLSSGMDDCKEKLAVGYGLVLPGTRNKNSSHQFLGNTTPCLWRDLQLMNP